MSAVGADRLEGSPGDPNDETGVEDQLGVNDQAEQGDTSPEPVESEPGTAEASGNREITLERALLDMVKEVRQELKEMKEVMKEKDKELEELKRKLQEQETKRTEDNVSGEVKSLKGFDEKNMAKPEQK